MNEGAVMGDPDTEVCEGDVTVESGPLPDTREELVEAILRHTDPMTLPKNSLEFNVLLKCDPTEGPIARPTGGKGSFAKGPRRERFFLCALPSFGF